MQFRKKITLLLYYIKTFNFNNMNFKKIVLVFVILFLTTPILAQKTAIYTNPLTDYNYAVELYQNKSYLAAQIKFDLIKNNFDSASELKANCEYFAANCAIRLGQRNSDELMQSFVDTYPTSTKRNSAFIDVADYYYKTGKYAYASKWYTKVNSTNFSFKNEEDYNFKYAYSLFATKNYAKAKQFFLTLLDSQTYGAQAKYYYGYIAYNQDDYDTAGKYLGEVANESSYKSNVSYYLSEMNFKLGNFEKAIEYGLPILETAKREELSEISKIVGESYFNLKKYENAIPHLLNYKGKRGKWTNTDYYFLGYAYYAIKNFESAVNYFNKIVNGENGVAQNAYYHLAKCYLNLDQKKEALNAFRNAAHMKFKPEIQKDAWLNYAKLSYEIGNPYKSIPDVLKQYIFLYPKSAHRNEINNLIISSYLVAKDYKGALEYLNNNKQTTKEKTMYQKASYFYGIELFNERKYSQAIENFKNSLSISVDPKIAVVAVFWKGESNYRLNNFSEALSDFHDFIANIEAKSTGEYEHINYNIAYANFKLKEYTKAVEEFQKYLQKKPKDRIRENDSYLRIGDAYFINRNYARAIEYYNQIIERNGNDADYAQFQKAISYGLTGDENAKITELKSFLIKNKKSIYKDDALYVLGNSYIKKNNITKALESFNNLISNFNRSPLVSKAMLKIGLIFYNNDENEQALSAYKKVVSNFPNTPEGNQAVKDARQIYLDLGRIDEYATWVKSVDFIKVTDAELDNDTYESAEKQFLHNNHKKSISSFKKYIQNFPNGLHSLQANFYLAQSLYSDNQHLQAIPHYTFVANREPNEFTENSLFKLALVYLEESKWPDAIPVLERLETEAASQENIIFATSNLMKGYYEVKNYNKAVEYADLVLKNSKLEDRIKSDAYIIVARSAIITNDKIKAREAYHKVEELAFGRLKAEALYYSAYFENEDGSYRISNEIVQKIAAEYSAHKYWGAKGLVLMARNYNELQDAFQATYILESVIKNFAQFEDVVEEAKAKLDGIKKEQAKTNESVKN